MGLPYRYINHDELAALIKSSGPDGSGKDYQIVDVRDEDFEGGNIPGAIHAPSDARTDASVQKLVEQLTDVPRVIFHCSLSQVRGPKTARIYAEAAAAARAQSSSSSDVPAPDSSASSSSTTTTQAAADAARNFSPNPYATEAKEGQQEVLVLRDGFKNWQGLYKNDPLLVENFDSRIWRDWTSFGPQQF
ncbi:hypothetical protein JCM6882_002200 [Rhodosporidiobolus microsporus]